MKLQASKEQGFEQAMQQVEALEVHVMRLRVALERIANRLPEKWPDQAIARAALANEDTK